MLDNETYRPLQRVASSEKYVGKIGMSVGIFHLVHVASSSFVMVSK